MYKLLIVLLLCSCATRSSICRYDGLQIVEKDSPSIGPYIILRTEDGLTNRVYLTQYDYDLYEVGDTVNCNKSKYEL